MKFGVREICDVVLKAKTTQTIGNKTFEQNEPVIYFDTAKTSSLEGAATTVYATGGSGNSRLIAWEGERTLTFTMEDALLSPLGFAILSGAGLIDASATEIISVHATSYAVGTVDTAGTIEVDLSEALGDDTLNTSYIYAMLVDSDGEASVSLGKGVATGNKVVFTGEEDILTEGDHQIFVDYYVNKIKDAQQIDIEPGKFTGNFYLEASTLFRRQKDGFDLPAEFVIPNIKIQSNFTFSMASTGDPSTFTFVMDAFPDYTKFNPTKKVLAALQIIG